MHISAEDQGTFCLVFAFSFTSCYNTNVAVQQFERSVVTEISKRG